MLLPVRFRVTGVGVRVGIVDDGGVVDMTEIGRRRISSIPDLFRRPLGGNPIC
ncbi:MAG: hypothetical protein QXD61_08070 [Candidatus Caldarchaeum sp.]